MDHAAGSDSCRSAYQRESATLKASDNANLAVTSQSSGTRTASINPIGACGHQRLLSQFSEIGMTLPCNQWITTDTSVKLVPARLQSCDQRVGRHDAKPIQITVTTS